MTKPRTSRFLVVVVPAPAVAPIGAGSTGYTFAQQPPVVVKTIEATSASEAAEKAGVTPGATAHVAKLAHVSKFKRSAKAKLEAA